MNAKDQLKQ